MLLISTIIGKSLLKLLRVVDRRGSALPGLVVEKIQPGFLRTTLGQLPDGIVIVTGTNGKTTTTKIIGELLQSQGLKVLTNPTGSNFIRGIISTVIENIGLTGKLSYDIAVFEQDEAHAVHFTNRIRPHGVVALNVMRDQMDRFGEIDKTAELLGKVVSKATDWVVLNANDPRIARLRQQVSANKIVWFGHNEALLAGFVGDDQYHSHQALKYFKAADIDVCLTGLAEGKIEVKLGGVSHKFKTLLDGDHNALNITAALAALKAVKKDTNTAKTAQALAAIQPAFGRGERILLKNGTPLRLQLVKNPAGFTHAMRLLGKQNFAVMGIAINDNYPDGRDVSWLWDVDFSPLLKWTGTIFCGGSRGYDMAVRLKYDEVPFADTILNLGKFLKATRQSADQSAPAIIFCTYTAMLKLRKLIKPYAKVMNEEGL